MILNFGLGFFLLILYHLTDNFFCFSFFPSEPIYEIKIFKAVNHNSKKNNWHDNFKILGWDNELGVKSCGG